MTIPETDIPITQNFEQPHTYAESAWTPEDVCTIFEMPLAEAEEFLRSNQSHIRNAMIEAGWEAMETCGKMDGLTKVKDDAAADKT